MHMTETQTTRITVTLPQPVVEQLDAYAAEHRWSRSTAAAELIETCLADMNRTHGDKNEKAGR
jgi:metal-responsive CopG/Arc/MetJ family transcriptional regulator